MKRVTMICDTCLSPRKMEMHTALGHEELRSTCTASSKGAQISVSPKSLVLQRNLRHPGWGVRGCGKTREARSPRCIVG